MAFRTKGSSLLRKSASQSLRYASDQPQPVVHIPPNSKIYAFGAPSQTRTPLIGDVGWNVQEGEAWAIVSGTGGGGKGALFKARQALLGYARIAPSSSEAQGEWAANGGLYPFMHKYQGDPYTRIAHVSFRQRSGGEPGAFFDYTARYGAMREAEDRVTVRESLLPNGPLSPEKQTLFLKLIVEMNLEPLLDLPILTLSNGQTRRARVVKAILDEPEVLLLDEPLTGLDVTSRKSINKILDQLHRSASPRIIIGIRRGEDVPPWITHVLDIQDGVATQLKQDGGIQYSVNLPQKKDTPKGRKGAATKVGDLVVEMEDVNVAYGARRILTNINWQIRQGERWHLRGSNGSGKTTLLALLNGDHPQSYVQDHLLLPSFSSTSSTSSGPSIHPRRGTPTGHLRRLIGVVSPEMFDAFPRRHPGMSVWEAISTGFDGGFVPRTRGASLESRRKGGAGWVDVSDEEVDLEMASRSATAEATSDKEQVREELRQWRISRCWEVLGCLGPAAWLKTISADVGASVSPSPQGFESLPFPSLLPGEQRLVLLMRALVGRPPLVLLDEVWSGMDDAMIAAARRYLRGEVSVLDKNGQLQAYSGVNGSQAVVVITHWEDEVPWSGEEVKNFSLG